MGLDPPGPLAGMVLQAAPGGIEGVAQGDVDVLVGVALPGIAVDHHLLARDAHLDVDVEKVALHVLAADGFDHNAAGRDPAIDLLQLCHLFPHPRLYGVGVVEIAESDFQGRFNRNSRSPAALHDTTRHSVPRSEEHTSELQSLMRTSYAVFCLKT